MATDPTPTMVALKEQLNILDEADDAVIGRLCGAAAAHVSADLGFPLTDIGEFPAGPPADVQQAILMLAAHWYENREATLVGVTAQSVPFGYEAIIANHRSYTFG